MNTYRIEQSTGNQAVWVVIERTSAGAEFANGWGTRRQCVRRARYLTTKATKSRATATSERHGDKVQS